MKKKLEEMNLEELIAELGNVNTDVKTANEQMKFITSLIRTLTKKS